MSWFNRHGHWLLTLFVAFVLVQSLFFKFTGSPETVYISQGKVDPWAASLGFPGLFVRACGVWVSCALLLWLRRDRRLECCLARVRG